ncbi:epithelial-stromal interaction protein 1 [Archocentrus centrarchus]|uniref:epithelial-stromal interaction protein 1 n=1 Tax=Archocentrus centrarchus TaxID=63155 RepID=UPI0011EA01DE|nr:epithelial-stromal interaction protein 1 [Archocentrus centrarchus]
MDSYHNQRHTRNSGGNNNTGHPRGSASDAYGQDETLPNPNVQGNPQVAARQPRYSDGYTMIPPNESKRSEIKTMAQKEEEALNRWKETQRVSSVHLNPERLGGDVTLVEVRQRQQTELYSTKLQKKIKKAEDDKRRKQEEEEKLQEKKNIQRKKAELLDERKHREYQRRREELEPDRLRTQESFLQMLERTAPNSSASISAMQTSSRSTDVESKQTKEPKSLREVQLEHKRVNAAFLDKLEHQGRGSETEPKIGSAQEAECSHLAAEDFRQQATTGQVPLSHLKPDPEQSCSGSTQEADPEAEYDWALMKLINRFPDCNKSFLEDILMQCNKDYEEAYTLLISTFS